MLIYDSNSHILHASWLWTFSALASNFLVKMESFSHPGKAEGIPHFFASRNVSWCWRRASCLSCVRNSRIKCWQTAMPFPYFLHCGKTWPERIWPSRCLMTRTNPERISQWVWLQITFVLLCVYLFWFMCLKFVLLGAFTPSPPIVHFVSTCQHNVTPNKIS